MPVRCLADFFRKGQRIMANAKPIFCPICKKRVAIYDGKSKTNVMSKCNDCQKRVLYLVDEDITVLRKLPTRNCSSGVNFSW